MRRVVATVERLVGAADVDGARWQVDVRLMPADNPAATGPGEQLVPPYPLHARRLSDRRVPTAPPYRAPPPDASHAELCTGDVRPLEELMRRLRTRDPRPDDVAVYGRWLLECLLGPAWPVIRAHPDVTASRGLELALRWPVDELDLHRLVWEAMRDEEAPLAGHPRLLVAITRLVPAAPAQLTTIDGVPRVLFASGSPLSDPTVRPGAMYMGLLRTLDAGGRCRSRALQHVSIEDLRAECVRFAPHVVHLVAHGVDTDSGGALMMRADATGGGVNGSRSRQGQQEADATALIGAITAGGAPIAAALSACNSSRAAVAVGPIADADAMDPAQAAPLAAQLVAAGIPIVTAMSGEVSEPACRQYTRRLAEGVYSGNSVIESSAHGRRAALVSAAAPRAELDWALPALFLNEHVDAGRHLVDPNRSEKLLAAAGQLKLRREPVFIGRQSILATTEHLVERTGGIGVLAVLAPGVTVGLGGHRLLQEIGWRLLRSGHVPLLLGPYPKTGAPLTGSTLVAEILKQAVSVAQYLGLPPTMPITLPDLPGGGALPGAETPAPRAREMIRRRITAFADAREAQDPETARDLLAEDLTGLARQAGELGDPFGPHSRTVVLCHNVHDWATPTPAAAAGDAAQSALGLLLGMLPAHGLPYGLGDADRPVPVVLTGSRTLAGGPSLGEWSTKATPGLSVQELGELDADEAVLGFQWVLLHPWTTVAAEDLPIFGRVYTPLPSFTDQWENGLRRLDRQPTTVEDSLYTTASVVAGMGMIKQDDDEQAWRDYVERFPEYRL